MIRSLLAVFCLLSLGSCELNTSVDVALPQQQRFKVVNAILRPGQPMDMSLMQSITLNDKLSYGFVFGATIHIFLDGKEVPLSGFLYLRQRDNVIVNYSSTVLLPVDQGGVLSLQIVSDEDTITATTTMPRPILVTSCRIDDDQVVVTLPADENPTGQLYKLDAFVYHDGDKISRYSDTFNCSTESGAPFSIKLRLPTSITRDSTKVVVARINSDYYSYLYTIGKAFDAFYDPFTVPLEIKSNVKGGTGIFTVVDDKLFWFK